MTWNFRALCVGAAASVFVPFALPAFAPVVLAQRAVATAAAPLVAPAAPAEKPENSARVREAPLSPAARDAVAKALARAREVTLAESPTWRRLLFITPGWFSSRKSLVDGPRFFLAESGRTDPAAELYATVEAFFHAVEDYESPDMHPQCRFPGRFYFLREALALEPEALAKPPCARFQTWFSNVRSDGASLVFSNYYLNNPSSMFGHTFLRLHRRSEVEGVRRSPLLDWSVSYAAYPYTLNPFLYPVLGLSGAFPGMFQLQPYYVKIQEYNDNESRDLWEYELSLKKEGLDALLRSLWELGEEKINYYYLDDNCAYILLALIEVADPRVDLTSRFKAWVTPSDTVRVVARVPGLVNAVRYRPSNRSRFLERWDALSPAEKDLAAAVVAAGAHYPLDAAWSARDPDVRARVLDAALEFVDFREKVALAEEGSAEWKALRGRYLSARAATRVVSAPLRRRPESERPDDGHSTNRFGLTGGAGFTRGGGGARPFAQIEWRPSLHDLMAPGTGYPIGMGMSFFDTVLREDFDRRRFTLRALDVLSIMSAQPVSRLVRPTSWRLRFGTAQRDRCYGRGNRSCFLTSIGGGSGAAFATASGGALAFVLPGAELGWSQEKDAGPYAAPTAMAGFLVSPTSRYRVGLFGDYARRYGWGGAALTDWDARLEQAFAPVPNFEMRARVGYGKQAAQEERLEASVSVFLYYE